MRLWEIERELKEQGYSCVCGIDEAGRGPLAGDVYAAAVILPFGLIIDGLDDSKKLKEHKREAVFEAIITQAYDYAVGIADIAEIESMNILNATFLAMNRAVSSLKLTHGTPDLLLVDGDKSKGFTIPVKTIIGGDAKCASIAAASVLAKVSRDRYMLKLDREYPEYNFKKHKGYGTKEHREMIKKYGASPVHRKSFLGKILGETC